jgi:hypothetical protein
MKPAKQLMDFDPIGIGELLARGRLVVPLNQREYAWEDDQVNDLIHDFAGAMKSKSGIHFLGSILLTTANDSDHPEITDGQQRLATVTMLLAAFRDYLIGMDKKDDAISIERDFLFKWDRGQGENVPRLRLNALDLTFFETTILAREKPTKKKEKKLPDSHRKIERAASIIHDYIVDRLSPEKDALKTKIINEWIKFIDQNALVVAITVSSDLDAYAMFETLNDRGLETSQADLLKNHLFSQVGDRMKEAQQKWSSMIGKLESAGRRSLPVTFIRHLLITTYGHTKQRDVLKTVKEEVTKSSEAIKFLDGMDESADDYVAMLNPSHPKWNAYGSTRDHLLVIHEDLEVKQIWPVLFAVARHFSVPEAKKAFRYLVNLSVRFLIVGGRGGLLDTNYAAAAQNIGTGKTKTAVQLADVLTNIAPKDETFEVEFANARVSEANLARYYLRAMENFKEELPSPEVMPITDRSRLTLEHVLPENPGGNWPNFTEDDAKAYYRRIGNFVLMMADHNHSLGNCKFADKKPVFLKSGLALTKMVGREKKWTQAEIDGRQKELAKLAVKTWPLDIK